MENYEINDVRNRLQTVPSLVNITAKLESSFSVFLEIENIGNQVARNVLFEIPKELEQWAEEQKAKLFKIGIKFFPPQQKYRFRYGFINSIFHESSKIPSQFEISVSYDHPLYSERITESFGIDLLSYFGSYAGKDQTLQQVEKVEKSIKELTEQVKKLNSTLGEITNISGASGLTLSVSTLRNLKNIVEKKEIDKINPIGQHYLFFMELLGIHWRLAHEIEDYFRHGNKSEGLTEIKDIDEETLEKIRNFFVLDSIEIEK